MKRLSSLLLTLYALGGVVLLLIVGMIMAQLKPFSLAMPTMDQGLILGWLLGVFEQGPVMIALGLWFLALCASVGLLVVNLCACTWTRLLPRIKNGARLHTWLLILAHVLMVVILVGHLSQMCMGFKQENIKLLAGQAVTLPDGQQVKVEQVTFADNPDLLNLTYRQGRRAQTADVFHRERNVVRVSLWENGQAGQASQLRILEPLLAGSLRVTLSDFYRDEAGDKAQVGAVLTITKNPFTRFFFSAYVAWILVYIALAVQAFVRRPTNGNNHNETGAAS